MCSIAFAALAHLTRGAQIPIAERAARCGRPTSTNRGFLPWRFSYAGRPSSRHGPTRPASENLHKGGRDLIRRFVRSWRKLTCDRQERTISQPERADAFLAYM